MVPPTRTPVIELILQLYPANFVNLLVDELLVTGCAEFRAFEQSSAQTVDVVLRIRPDQEVTKKSTCLPFPQFIGIAFGLGHYIIRIPGYVCRLNGVARKAGDPFLVARQAG